MTTYINLYGGPGTGKSTIAAGLFYYYKSIGKDVELCTEFVKDLVWEDRTATLAFQPYVSMKQYRNLARLKDKVDIVITDSPLLKDIVYTHKFSPDLPDCFTDLLQHLHISLGDSIELLLTRSFDYSTVGRYQTEQEAKQLDHELAIVLETYSPNYFTTLPDIDLIKSIIERELTNE